MFQSTDKGWYWGWQRIHTTEVCRRGPGYRESRVHFGQVGMKSVNSTVAGNVEADTNGGGDGEQTDGDINST